MSCFAAASSFQFARMFPSLGFKPPTPCSQSQGQHEHGPPPCSSLNRCRYPPKQNDARRIKQPHKPFVRLTTEKISGLLPFVDKEWSKARSLHDLARLVRMVIEMQTSTNHKKEEAVCGFASGRCSSDFRTFLPAFFLARERLRVFSRQRV